MCIFDKHGKMCEFCGYSVAFKIIFKKDHKKGS